MIVQNKSKTTQNSNTIKVQNKSKIQYLTENRIGAFGGLSVSTSQLVLVI